MPLPLSLALAERIPLSAGAVLWLGCGDGAAAAALRRVNPAARLIGIEADPALARQAARVLDQVFCLSVEPGPLPALPPLDCIVVAPGQAEGWDGRVFAELGRRLAPGGTMLAWLPAGALAAQHGVLTAAGLSVLGAEEAGEWLVWRAMAAPPAPLKVYSTMLPPVGGVSQVRVVEPLAALAIEPGVATGVAHLFDELPERDGAAGVFVLHRPALLGAEGLAQVRALAARGWVVVCEFDDHPSQIPILHRSDVQNFRAVHAIQTTTPALAEVLRRENPEVAVFPNAIRALPEPANFVTPGRLTLLFAALNREEDWPGHVEAIAAAANAAAGALQVRVIADQGFFDALATPHKDFAPLSDYATYLDVLGRCELSFMPLRDTLFNRCKSDLKFLEAAAHRAVAVASPTVYADSIRDGATGVIFDSPPALYARLMQLVAQPAMARTMAEQARAEVARHRMLGYQMARRVAWYRSLWARRGALHRALLERVPELG